MAFLSTSATRATLPRFRLRLRFLFCRMWRLPCLRRSTFPVAVTLNRLETDFLVLAIPAFLDIGAASVEPFAELARAFPEIFTNQKLGFAVPLSGFWHLAEQL